MVSSWLSFNSSGFEDFTRAATALSEVETEFPKWVRKDISDEMEKLKDTAGAALEAMAVHGLKQTGLRAAIDSGMTISDYSDTSGEGSQISTTAPRPGGSYLPRGLDVLLAPKGWKHPVFGNKKKWVQEVGNVPWFSETMQSAQPEMEQKIQEEIEAAIKQISGE